MNNTIQQVCFAESVCLEEYDLTIRFEDCRITVQDSSGKRILRIRAQVNGRPLLRRDGVLTDGEGLRRWMKSHVGKFMKNKPAILVEVLPYLSADERRWIEASLHLFKLRKLDFIKYPVAVSLRLAKQRPLPREYQLFHDGNETAWAAIFSSGEMVAYKEIQAHLACKGVWGLSLHELIAAIEKACPQAAKDALRPENRIWIEERNAVEPKDKTAHEILWNRKAI
jgi:hypothetical protein